MIVEINRTGNWEPIQCLIQVGNRLSLVTENDDEPRYAPDTFDFTILDPPKELIDYFTTTHKKTKVRLFSEDGGNLTFLFEGDIETGSQIIDPGENEAPSLSLSASDICGRLDRPGPSEGWNLLGEDLQTVAQTVCNYAEVTHNFPIEMSQIVVDYFITEGGDNRENCLDRLDQVLFEKGYVLSAKYDNGIAEVSAYDWWHRGFQKTNVYPELECDKFFKPLQINTRQINYDILNVEWTIAGHFDRGHTEKKDGLLLYHLGTDSKIPILAEHYYPERGNLEKVYQSYNADFIRNRSDSKKSDYSQSDLLISKEANPRESRIIYAWDQYIEFIAQAVSVKIPGGDSRPEVLVSGSPDIPQQLDVVIEDHSKPQRSQVLFYNQTKQIANLVQKILDEHGDSLNLNVDISEGWTVELRDFVILGNAVYSQGEGNAVVEIFSSGEEQTISSVVREATRAKIYLQGGSNIPGHYIGFKVISENGTNATVNDYFVNLTTNERILVINDFNTVSEFDTLGTRINLISPTDGVREESIVTDFTYSQEDANRLAEGKKNHDLFGRFNFVYDGDFDHPKIGKYVKLNYSKFDITEDVWGQVVGYEWSPDSQNNKKVNIIVKRINEFNPLASFPGRITVLPPIDQPPTTAGGWEIIRATTPTKNLLPGQYPDNRWGYRTPGTRGELNWQNYP